MHRTPAHATRLPLLALVIALLVIAPAVGSAQNGYTGVVTLLVTLDDASLDGFLAGYSCCSARVAGSTASASSPASGPSAAEGTC